MLDTMKILLGGIPLGCNNIGDEAILGCVVRLLRKLVPDAELTVCTRSPEETEKRLAIHSAPLFGFTPEAGMKPFARFVRNFDFYIWCGATGLSDYPATGIKLLQIARKNHIRTIVWGVGMDSELNPAFFQVRGKKKFLLDLLSGLCFRRFPFAKYYEQIIAQCMRKRITKALNECDLVVVRDPQTREELERGGFHRAIPGADTAILQETGVQNILTREPGKRYIGFCISAQRAISDWNGMLNLFRKLLSNSGMRIVFIPMNPQTDFQLMDRLNRELDRPEQTLLIHEVKEPGEIQAIAEQCDVIVSSRLHLLILSANARTPPIGISRGSKVDNFLANFNQESIGSVYSCDFDRLYDRILEASSEPFRKQFKDNADHAYEHLKERLISAEKRLKEVLNS